MVAICTTTPICKLVAPSLRTESPCILPRPADADDSRRLVAHVVHTTYMNAIGIGIGIGNRICIGIPIGIGIGIGDGISDGILIVLSM